MITQEQIEKYCKLNKALHSKMLFATLDYDYQVEYENYTVPAGTIVQVCLYETTLADLYVNGECITYTFPYDAATLLEDEA